MIKKVLLLILILNTFCLAQGNAVNVSPIIIQDYDKKQVFTKSIYSIETQFAEKDTVLFVNKNNWLSIVDISAVNANELLFSVQIDSGFSDFTRHQIVVLDSNFNKKIYAEIDFRYSNPPLIDEIVVIQSGRAQPTELQLSGSYRTIAYLTLRGKGLFKTTNIEFDDPKIKVLGSNGWRIDNPPNELTVGLEIDSRELNIGEQRFRVKNNFSMESWGDILIKSDQPPQIISSINSFIADGSEHIIPVSGNNFYNGIIARLLPDDGYCKVKIKSQNQLDVIVDLPVLDNSKSYKLLLINKDNQADTSGFFTVRGKPLGRARIKTIDQGSIFLGKKNRVVLAIDPQSGYLFIKNRSYEVKIEGNRFPVTSVIDDSTCETVIRLEEEESVSILNQHVFTINEIDYPARWKGTLSSRPSPKLNYMSPLRIIHPVDSLSLVFKGKNLQNVSMYIEDPEVVFKITENRGDLLRITAIAGKFVSPGSYPLELRIDGVPFIYQNFRVEVQPWQPFSEFVGMEISSVGFMTPNKLWQGSSIARPIKASDAINVRLFSSKIREELGEQKVEISGVLMDSSNTIRAEAFDKKVITIAKGSDIVNWHWRVRERMRSGDRIEITLRNTGGQNKITETFYVEPHWSESFHGSTSFILFKVPLGGGEASTEIFRSMGIGISYQPDKNRKFLAFDGSFILGNVADAAEDVSMQVGLGLSVILWSHLQIGIGTNLTGQSFSNSFTFVGTRFKLSVPW